MHRKAIDLASISRRARLLAAMALAGSLALGLTPAAVAAAPEAAVLLNGSFETGTNPPAVDRTLYATTAAPNRDIRNWVVVPVPGQTNGSIDWYKNTSWQAADGAFSLDLNGFGSAGSIYQDIAGLERGGVYVVVFSMSGNPDAGPVEKKLKVSIDTQSATFNFNTTGVTRQNMRYQTKAFAFVWNARNSRLRFDSLVPGPSGYGPVLDNVRLFRVL